MSHETEITTGERFSFGKNWSEFLNTLTDEKIVQAEDSLKEMLGIDSLKGKKFLDIGSGSGLFSLAARRLGAQVYSFDYDPQSVTCTAKLKDRFYHNDNQWVVEEGSILDSSFIEHLGRFDFVYSWGVLHHTGEMWLALENILGLIQDGGKVYVALYNTSAYSGRWKTIKKTYCGLPTKFKSIFAVFVIAPIQINKILNAAIRLKLPEYFSEIRNYGSYRGMNWWIDQVDWLGGYPYETAKPEEIFYFFKENGFTINKLETCGGGTGCNEYVFDKNIGEMSVIGKS